MLRLISHCPDCLKTVKPGKENKKELTGTGWVWPKTQFLDSLAGNTIIWKNKDKHVDKAQHL